MGVYAFELRDPPGGAGGDFFDVGCVFVDVEGSVGERVGCQEGGEGVECGSHVAVVAFHVPRPLVGDAVVGFDEAEVFGPPCVILGRLFITKGFWLTYKDWSSWDDQHMQVRSEEHQAVPFSDDDMFVPTSGCIALVGHSRSMSDLAHSRYQ